MHERNTGSPAETRSNERDFRAVFDHIGTATLLLASDGTIVRVNRQFERMSGYAREQIEGKKNWTALVPDADADLVGPLRKSCTMDSAGGPRECEFRLLEFGGGSRHVLARLSSIPGTGEIAVTFSEPTGSRPTEQDSFCESRNYRTIVEHSRAAILIIQEGRVVFVNPRLEELTEYDSEELKGRLFTSIIYPEDREFVYDRYRRRLTGEEQPECYDFRLRSKDGNPRWVQITVGLCEWEGRPATLCLFNDVSELRRAQAELCMERDRIRQILETSPVAITLVDPLGSITYANAQAADLFEIDREEIVARTYNVHEWKITAPDGTPMPDEALPFRRVSDTLEPVCDVRHAIEAPDGRRVQLNIHAAPILDPEGRFTGMVSAIDDVTEKVRIEAELAESEARFRTLFERLDNIPVQGYDAERNVIYWNPASERVYGYSREEAVGRKLEDLIIPDSMREHVVEAVRRWVEEGIPIPAAELVLRNKHGSEVPVYSSHVLHVNSRGEKEMYCVDVDLSPLRRAEAELLLLGSVVNQIGEGVMIRNLDGIIEYVNPAFEQMTGFTSDRIVGQSPHVLEVSGNENELDRNISETLAEGNTWRGRITHRRHDGDSCTVELAVSAVKDKTGKTTHLVGIGRDITETIALQQQYEHAQKMESVGRLAGGVAHDFNNMLSPILGYAEMLRQDLPAGDPMRTAADEIFRSAIRARDLTAQLLAFGRRQTLEMTALDINQVMLRLKSMLSRVIGEDVRVVARLTDDLPLAAADPGKIEQVIMNLAINARDAMPGGGTLTIETAAVTTNHASQSDSQTTRRDAWVVVAVTDTGVGIPRQELPRLFDPFYTTKVISKGSGLGLATVYGIVKQHGGNITVDSEPGQGTRFEIYLPVSSRSRHPMGRIEQPGNGGSRRETVMVVEDQKQVRDLACRILQRWGYTMFEFADPVEALEFSHDHETPIDLLLTDVIMPAMNGRELYDAMRAKRPELKVLYMSGYPDEVIGPHGVSGAGVKFLPKPFTLRGLTAKVREALDARKAEPLTSSTFRSDDAPCPSPRKAPGPPGQ